MRDKAPLNAPWPAWKARRAPAVAPSWKETMGCIRSSSRDLETNSIQQSNLTEFAPGDTWSGSDELQDHCGGCVAWYLPHDGQAQNKFQEATLSPVSPAMANDGRDRSIRLVLYYSRPLGHSRSFPASSLQTPFTLASPFKLPLQSFVDAVRSPIHLFHHSGNPV